MRCPDLPGLWRSCFSPGPDTAIPIPAYLDDWGVVVFSFALFVFALLIGYLISRSTK